MVAGAVLSAGVGVVVKSLTFRVTGAFAATLLTGFAVFSRYLALVIGRKLQRAGPLRVEVPTLRQNGLTLRVTCSLAATLCTGIAVFAR